MPRRSRPLRARARAGIRSTTIKNPGARCAPAKNINRGSQPSATTALLPPSRPTLARQRQARSLNYPGPSRRCLLRQRAATPKPVPPIPASGTAGTRCRVPCRRPSRAHTAPMRARPSPCKSRRPGIRPGCGHPRPGLPGHANIRRTLLPFPHGAQVSPGSAYRRKCPADLPLHAPTAVGAPRKHRAAVLRIPGRQPACMGRKR